MFESNLRSVHLTHRGKVRDIYDAGKDHLLIVTTDRLSAFDVILPTPIPGKGRVLTALSRFWFNRSSTIIAHHLVDSPLETVVADAEERRLLEGRVMIVRKLQPLAIEAIVRGYLIGSGFEDYRKTGAVCGIRLPQGLRLAERLPEPIFTPSTKAAIGAHDQNITLAQVENLVGAELAHRVERVAIAVYEQAAQYAAQRGIIIADTKMEFGLDATGALVLIDELLTPDSSRFWPKDTYRVGVSPPSFDKQYVRDYLERLRWDKKPPAPTLPDEVVAQTAAKYSEAAQRLMGAPH
jgi:phosphoribosylaminoimidazole-succinocarboxamide synthase